MRSLNLLFMLALAIMSGCAGVDTFSDTARQGDTIAVAAGWKQNFRQDSITVTVTDAAFQDTVYLPGDPAIRAVTNFYPDPLSQLVVDNRLGQAREGEAYGALIDDNYTDGDPDWWQTVVFIDLPTSMTDGPASILVEGPGGESHGPVDIEILPGIGSPHLFTTDFFGAVMSPIELKLLSRVPHYTIDFSGSTVPHAIEVTLRHDPDSTVGGSGKAIAINPRGEIKSLNWSDDGTTMRVIMLRANDMVVSGAQDFKFYIAGDVTGLSLDTIKAFGQDGAEDQDTIATCVGCI